MRFHLEFYIPTFYFNNKKIMLYKILNLKIAHLDSFKNKMCYLIVLSPRICNSLKLVYEYNNILYSTNLKCIFIVHECISIYFFLFSNLSVQYLIIIPHITINGNVEYSNTINPPQLSIIYYYVYLANSLSGQSYN